MGSLRQASPGSQAPCGRSRPGRPAGESIASSSMPSSALSSGFCLTEAPAAPYRHSWQQNHTRVRKVGERHYPVPSVPVPSAWSPGSGQSGPHTSERDAKFKCDIPRQQAKHTSRVLPFESSSLVFFHNGSLLLQRSALHSVLTIVHLASPKITPPSTSEVWLLHQINQVHLHHMSLCDGVTSADLCGGASIEGGDAL